MLRKHEVSRKIYTEGARAYKPAAQVRAMGVRPEDVEHCVVYYVVENLKGLFRADAKPDWLDQKVVKFDNEQQI